MMSTILLDLLSVMPVMTGLLLCVLVVCQLRTRATLLARQARIV